MALLVVCKPSRSLARYLRLAMGSWMQTICSNRWKEKKWFLQWVDLHPCSAEDQSSMQLPAFADCSSFCPACIFSEKKNLVSLRKHMNNTDRWPYLKWPQMAMNSGISGPILPSAAGFLRHQSHRAGGGSRGSTCGLHQRVELLQRPLRMKLESWNPGESGWKKNVGFEVQKYNHQFVFLVYLLGI